ncbi:MarR family transcriptional regulator [Actinoplanes sichuanensis]|uniref:MarR family transcriptional regulator n=1 Tax=Actinoplanes sichuanensis TaxID=512349 RepID=A0ABW4AMG2_9ACTN|nr:helix-turn-helix domain-containing protein [Actinoplanes sichuanensis]
MPGNRLTAGDRRQIEEALAADMSFAAIGRRLNRPASTISREVLRNGGPERYRAEHAQHATDWRAHRRTPGTVAPAEAGSEAVDAFADDFVRVMLRTGLPPMAARVLARLMVTDTASATAADLAERLRVSRAAVSRAVGYLETVAMIRRERPAGQRREHYVVDDGMWRAALADTIRTNTMWAETARQGSDLLGRDSPAGIRLHWIAVFFADLNDRVTGAPRATAAAGAVCCCSNQVCCARSAGPGAPTGEEFREHLGVGVGVGVAAGRVC